jgi:uncharacterized membrane protein YraQ (UPF0718 family)
MKHILHGFLSQGIFGRFLEKKYSQIARMGLSILLVFACVIIVSSLTGEAYSTFTSIFLSIIIEAVPFLLAGAIVSGLIHVFVDQRLLFRVVLRHPVPGVLLGSVAGLFFPVCECGVIPVTWRLYQKGLPVSTGITFLLAAPVVNPIVIASTYAAFGWSPMLFGRLGLSVVVSSTVGLIFSVALPREVLLAESCVPHERLPECAACHAHAAEHESNDSPPLALSRKARIYEALAIAGGDFLDMVRYVIAGALIAAVLQTIVPQTVFLQLRANVVTSILTMMLLAFVLSVCSTADAFLALAFTNLFPPAAILAFLVFGPMSDIKSTLMLFSVFRRRSIGYLILLAAMLTLTATVFLTRYGGW